MSKHLGNILEPIPLMDQHGADAVRWFMAAGGSPWAARRVGPRHDPGGRPQDPADLLEHGRLPGAVRAHRRTGRRRAADPAPADRPVLDRWVLSELQRAGRRGRRGAGGVRHPARPASCSRRSSTTCPTGTCAARRRRFWHGDPAALRTLHEAWRR